MASCSLNFGQGLQFPAHFKACRLRQHLEAGRGFLLCFKISGRGMTEPEACLPRVTRDLFISSSQRSAPVMLPHHKTAA